MQAKPLLDSFIKTTYALVWRGVSCTGSLFIKRRKDLIIVIGRDGGKFLDNAKYAFLELHDQLKGQSEILFSTTHKELAAILKQHQLSPLLREHGFKWIYLYLSAGIVIIDSVDWNENGHYFLVRGAKIVQLWHGIPFKEIELIKAQKTLKGKGKITRLAILLYWKLTGRYFTADLLITTSEFSTKLLKKCINAKEYLALGYPRNDILLKQESTPLDALNVDSLAGEIIDRWRKDGCRIIFYCPTFRKTLKDPFTSNRGNLIFLEKLSAELKVKFIIKLHPLIASGNFEPSPHNLLFLKPDSDIYPILVRADILITDYSSIAFDFLLLKKPIIYFLYDIDDYNKNDREFLLDTDKFLPGKKVFSLTELRHEILELTRSSNDIYIEARNELEKFLFLDSDHHSGERLAKALIAKPYNEDR